MKRIRPAFLLVIIFCIMFLLYAITLVLPYNLFAYAPNAPLSLGEIADREVFPALVFLGTFLTQFGLYVLAYLICRRHPQARLASLILAGGVILALLLTLTYPIGASDVVEYVNHGEALAFHGLNPLVVPIVDVPGAAFVQHSVFLHVTPNYGPIWIWISALVVRIMGSESLAPNLLGFKLVAVLSYAALAILIHRILRRRNPDDALAGLLFFAWNPLILYEFAVNGHNDSTMMAFALLGILFWQRRRPLLMVAALAFSFLIKVPTIVLLPPLLLAAARRQERARDFWRLLLVGGLVSLALVGVAYVSLPDSLASLTNLSGRSNLFTHSLPTLIALVLRLGGLGEHMAKDIVRAAAVAALGIWYVIQLWNVWEWPSHVLRYAYNVILFLLLFVTPWFQPWYVTWLVALAALRPHAKAPNQAGLLSATVMASYVVYGFAWFWFVHFANWGHTLGINALAVATTFLIPWAYTVWLWLRARPAHSPSTSP
jgi:hypothetical protein